ncbi:Sodium-dependent proline transporter [Bulinus truncatus]|nr:Sodium-dependent proline transporter [Bulinus truncatus]
MSFDSGLTRDVDKGSLRNQASFGSAVTSRLVNHDFTNGVFDQDFTNGVFNQDFTNGVFGQDFTNKVVDQHFTNRVFDQDFTNGVFDQDFTNGVFDQDFTNGVFDQDFTNRVVDQHFTNRVFDQDFTNGVFDQDFTNGVFDQDFTNGVFDQDFTNGVFDQDFTNGVFDQDFTNGVFDQDFTNGVFDQDFTNGVFDQDFTNGVFDQDFTNRVFDQDFTNGVFDQDFTNGVFDQDFTNGVFDQDFTNRVVDRGHLELFHQFKLAHVREQWTGKMDFLFSSLGYAVGLGNVWRFPYLAYSNGGGAFFIPYFTMVIFVGMPIFFLETIIGQFSSCGPTTCWEFCPFFKGCGFAMITVSFLTATYYNMLIAWAFYYVYASFESPVPWYRCGTWSTAFCGDKVHYLSKENCNTSGTALYNGVCQRKIDDGSVWLWNATLAEQNGISVTFPAKEYFERRVLGYGLGFDITNIGPLRYELVISLLVSWTIVIACLAKGLRVSGKVVYATATLPYVMLIILFARGIVLPGAGKGIQYYIVPNLSNISSAKMWKDAAVQIFFSLSSSYGGIIALSSYNKFENNILSDCLFVCIGNSATSIFAGFIVFSFLGFLSMELNVPIQQVAAAGPSLAFTIYPFCLTKLPGTNYWSVLFFATIILLGIDSQFVLTETVITGIIDLKPRLRHRKWITVLVVCVTMFLLGLPLTCNGGLDVLELMDTYSSGWNVLLTAVCECAAVQIYAVRHSYIPVSSCESLTSLCLTVRHSYIPVSSCENLTSLCLTHANRKVKYDNIFINL